ncbi:transcriptional regulator [Actinoplanes cyaneus]|uniref:Transcriptional regulator n=1 Tax=Actinoplanes cyaneus TaxID=52696 RepID=A0A919IJV5_9ACTN|nr:LCP family protein [Actinoplanes cyaneus]MCW2138907.1 transcriptional attenuator, LytR family [Actinoplanes cyaneus]GID66753.1 transcriptional regulator [Actinoplanes cyaneus]
MSATTSPSGNSSGRASVPPSGPAPGRSAGPGDRGHTYQGKGKGPRVRPRWGRIGLVAGGVALALALTGGIFAVNYVSGIDNDLKRTNAFSGLSEERPAKTVDGAINILLVGSDSRDPDTKDDDATGWRADTLMIMHVPADHKSAQIISIPRDLWVVVPRTNDAACSDGSRAKINASFAFGGLPRAVHTVECLTDVKIDNVMAIDFGGFKEVTDALGGVDLKVDQTITSIHPPHRVFKKGMMHMNGAQALDWVRQRKQFARGDFARMQHQQEFLKALMDKAASSGTLASPGKLDDFLNAVAKAVTVDQDFSLKDMVLQFRSLRGENLTFLTTPNKGSETIAGQSVVVSDREKALALFKAVKADTMSEWMTANPVKKS